MKPTPRLWRCLGTTLALPALLWLAPLSMNLHAQSGKAPASVTRMIEDAKERIREGNPTEAKNLLQRLMDKPTSETQATPQQVADALVVARQAYHNLGQSSAGVEALIEAAQKVHADNWRVFQFSASHLASSSPYGSMVDGKFQRQNWNGQQAESTERDRVQRLLWMRKATELVLKDENATAAERAEIILLEAQEWVRGKAAWEMQSLTDLTKLPEVEIMEGGRGFRGRGRGWGGPVSDTGYPVTAGGEPVYFKVPDTWEGAASDGERWRYLLKLAASTDPTATAEVNFSFASQIQSWLDVTTLRASGLWPRLMSQSVEDGEDPNKVRQSLVDLPSLKPEETITRLATGVKRHTLPEDYRFVAIIKEIASGTTPFAPEALQALATIYENRQQRDTAVSVWQELKERYGKEKRWLNVAEARLEQIQSALGKMDSGDNQPAGSNAKLDLTFRNADTVKLTARPIKVVELMEAMKKEFRDRAAGKKGRERNEWNWMTQAFNTVLNHSFSVKPGDINRYLGAEAASWDVPLKPAERHADRRVTLETPLTKAGVYFIEATFAGKGRAYCLVEITDLVLLTKPLQGESGTRGFVLDAINGRPVAKSTINAFGYRNDYRYEGNRSTELWFTRDQKFSTADDGSFVLKSDDNKPFNWMFQAQAPDGRMAFVGFNQFYRTYVNEVQDGQQLRMYITTDRPVYRPSQKVHLAAWARRATYADGKNGNEFAGVNFNCIINDPRGEKLLEQNVVADQHGALSLDLDLGEEATLGVYQIMISDNRQISGNLSFRVEEYKKPEFEVKVKTPEKPILLGEPFTATVEAKYYFGGAVTEAKVHYKVERTRHDASWFPVHPWDWLYGSGYWWRNNEYAWLPGFSGCIAYWPAWWVRQVDPPEVVAEATVPIGTDGTVKIPLETALAKELHGDQDHKYQITAEVTDSSRRMIVGTGSVVAPRQPYQVYVWADRGYYQAGAEAKISVQARMPDGSPVNGKAVIKVLSVTYKPDETPVEEEKARFEVTARDGQAATQVLQFPTAGQYRLAVEFDDGAGHQVAGTALTTVHGQGFDGKGFRFPDLEVVAEKDEYAPGEEASFTINIAQEGGSILVFERAQNGSYPKPKLLTLAQGKSTTFKLPIASNDQPNIFMEVVTVHGAKIHSRVVQVPVPPSKRIANLELTPSKEAYKPQEDGSVQVRITRPDGTPVQGPVILTGYDKALEYISGGSNVPNIRDFFWGWKRSHYPAGANSLQTVMRQVNVPGGLVWQPIGAFGNVFRGNGMIGALAGSGGGFGAGRGEGFADTFASAPMSRSSLAMSAPAPAAAPVPMEAAKAESSSISGVTRSDKDAYGAAGEQQEAEPMIRQDFADLLLWNAAVQTDAEGVAKVPVHFPDDLTTWKLRAWVLGPNTEVGEATVEVISRKDLLVRMQAPRFFVEKDEVVLSGIVHNELKERQSVRALLELDGKTLAPIDGQSTEQRFEIEPGGEHRFDWRVKVLAEGEAIVRIKALAAAESDAVEKKFPVFVHGMERQDAWSLALRSADATGKVEFEVPEKRRPAQTRLEVRYSPSLAAAMVDALPFLVSYPHGCTEQTLNRFVPTVVTQKVLKDLGLDLKAIRDKRVNLNAQELGDPARRATQWRRFANEDPVFDEKEVAKMAAAGIERLESMQTNDGGWGWWPGAPEGTVHLTAQVVEGLLVAQQAGAKVPEGMLSRGLDWLQRQEAKELRLLNLPDNHDDHKEYADDQDALTHAVLVAAGRGDNAMRTHLYNDRLKLSKAMQAQVGIACASKKENERRDMIIRNLEQFQKQDEENQTAWLDFGNDFRWWYWYNDEVETLAAYVRLRLTKDGKDEVASRLVKYLLNNRKHGTYWRSTRDTAAAINALAMYVKVSGETAPDMLVELWMDGKKLKEAPINKDNLFTFDHSLVLSGEELTTGKHQLEIRRKGNGPLYVNAYLSCFTLEDHLRAAGLEVKVERNLYKLIPEKTSDLVAGSRGQALQQQGSRYRREPLPEDAALVSGDLIEVEVIAESKNDYEYLMLEDFKPAGCEAVDLQSGYLWNQGISAYREFRDEKVAIYLERLPRGRQSFTYRLRAEIPGKFSALPSVITGMYAPELKGNAEERKVQISDAPEVK